MHVILLIRVKNGHPICVTSFPPKTRFVRGHIMHEEIE